MRAPPKPRRGCHRNEERDPHDHPRAPAQPGWSWAVQRRTAVAHQETLARVLGALTTVFGLVLTGMIWWLPIASRSLQRGYHPRVGLAGATLLVVTFGLG